MKAALICLILCGAAVAYEQRLKRSVLGAGLLGGHGWSVVGPSSYANVLVGPASHGGLLSPLGPALWGPSLAGASWGALAAPAVAAPVAAAPAVVAPAVGHGGGNIGPIAGEAIIRGPSGTVHSPAIQAGHW